MKEFDVCIIGSGAGAGPVAYTLSRLGKKVLVLEKGRWYQREDFTKDEIAVCRRSVYTPSLLDEPQVIEDLEQGQWKAESNADTGWDFWNGSMVGGSSNLMSGYFHRLKPIDFRLKSEFGEIEGSNTVDWPISYEEMEPYYTLVEKIVGVSGRLVQHPMLEPRSDNEYPFPALVEHPVAELFDKACHEQGYHPIPIPRAILTKPRDGRFSCSYSRFCGSYGCSTDAKGSSRAALLNQALATGNCIILPNSMAYKIVTNSKGNAESVRYFDQNGNEQEVRASIVVVACQAIETSRLLLMSKGEKHPNGLGNQNGQVGKNLIFSAGGVGNCKFKREDFKEDQFEGMLVRGPFVNRALQDWYVINDAKLGRMKGGTVDFLLGHPNPIRRANRLKWHQGKLLWGKDLQTKIQEDFYNAIPFQFEIFTDWAPNENCFVSLDGIVKDKWGLPVSKVRVGNLSSDLIPGQYIAPKVEKLLKDMGGGEINSSISGSPSANLVLGGCRFGKDPEKSVLGPDCRIHGTENVYVSDGSFMPTGGSVTPTWTIYANSFRVADIIADRI